MKCEESLVLLSELHAGNVEENTALLIHQHLTECPPCNDVFEDIKTIVISAGALRQAGGGLSFPDENDFWQRLTLVRRIRPVH